MSFLVITHAAGSMRHQQVCHPKGEPCDHFVSRRTVTTLDATRESVADQIDVLDTHTDRQSYRSEWVHWINVARDLPEEGGTLGPLPDGTVIKVTPEQG